MKNPSLLRGDDSLGFTMDWPRCLNLRMTRIMRMLRANRIVRIMRMTIVCR